LDLTQSRVPGKGTLRIENMKNLPVRLIVVVAIGVIAIPVALTVRARVAANYARSQAAYTRFQENQRRKAAAEQVAHANERALATLQAEVQAHPNELQAQWRLVNLLQHLKMVDAALPHLNTIVRLDPNRADAAVAVANSEIFLRRFRDAEQDYRKITQRWPGNVDAWQGLAASLYHQRLYADAAAAGRRALLHDPKDFGNRYIVAASGLEYALEFPNAPETQQALTITRKLLNGMAKEQPDSGDLQYKQGLTLFLEHNTQAALPYLRHAAALLPDRGNVQYDVAEILMSAGNYPEARTLLLAAIPRMPKMAGLYNLLSESYQYDRDAASAQAAIRASLTATQLAPSTPGYWDRLALSYLKVQDYVNAQQAFEKSLLLDPNRSYPYQQLAALYSRMGESRRATIAAQMAARMEANVETLHHIESLSAQYPGDINLLLIRADRYRALKMNDPARDLYRQILALQPDNAPALNGLAAIEKPVGNSIEKSAAQGQQTR
jgi:tetratricopeptide (TPR) repeat protein